MNRSKWIKVALGLPVLGLILAEGAVRGAGMVDFPIYDHNDSIGYIVKPNQAGKFLNKNAWAFNALSMPTTDAWNPKARPNLLLIGNSIIIKGIYAH